MGVCIGGIDFDTGLPCDDDPICFLAGTRMNGGVVN